MRLTGVYGEIAVASGGGSLREMVRCMRTCPHGYAPGRKSDYMGVTALRKTREHKGRVGGYSKAEGTGLGSR